jgi:hypothetical protein
LSKAHDKNAPTVAEQTGPRKVPRALLVIIVLCLAALYGWAAYGDAPASAPEKTVNNFYTAYFNRDYPTVAENLSVFWSVRFLPDYASMSAVELLENRSQIESAVAQVIADIEADNQLPEDVSIEIMKDYTKIGQKSAVVVYQFKEKEAVTSMEVAILILEDEKFRIFNMSAVDDSVLAQIQDLDIETIDQNFTDLMTSVATF